MLEPEFSGDWLELTQALADISDEDLVRDFNTRRLNGAVKSLSRSINFLLKQRLQSKGWSAESPIFRDPDYVDGSSVWKLDFVKGNISVEVAFNHGEAIAHNLIKPVLASELNHVQKAVQTKLGVIISATEAMKAAGNFDGAVGTFEAFVSYLKPYQNLLPAPIQLIGLEAPESFHIDSDSREVRQGPSRV